MKSKLHLDELAVESFVTMPDAGRARGTGTSERHEWSGYEPWCGRSGRGVDFT